MDYLLRHPKFWDFYRFCGQLGCSNIRFSTPAVRSVVRAKNRSRLRSRSSSLEKNFVMFSFREVYKGVNHVIYVRIMYSLRRVQVRGREGDLPCCPVTYC